MLPTCAASACLSDLGCVLVEDVVPMFPGVHCILPEVADYLGVEDGSICMSVVGCVNVVGP